MHSKLFIVTRADLPGGAQIAQSCHALRAFAAAYPDEERRWYATSNNLVVLAVPDETALRELVARVKSASVPVVCFREPDLSDELTAISIAPDGARFVSTLPLALKASSRSTALIACVQDAPGSQLHPPGAAAPRGADRIAAT